MGNGQHGSGLQRREWIGQAVDDAPNPASFTVIVTGRSQTVDCRWEVTRYFHRELTRAKLCPALRVLGQEIGFSFLTLGAVVFVLALARKRKLSLPVSRI